MREKSKAQIICEDQMLRKIIQTPQLKKVLRAWAENIKAKRKPAIFSKAYLEWLRTPSGNEERRLCTMLLNMMVHRDWDQMVAAMGRKLDPDVREAFEAPSAGIFYKRFKGVVIGHVRAYWEDFMRNRKKRIVDEID